VRVQRAAELLNRLSALTLWQRAPVAARDAARALTLSLTAAFASATLLTGAGAPSNTRYG
jgi:hypothetical protein